MALLCFKTLIAVLACVALAFGQLRLNHIQIKGTHNSYHIAPEPTLVDWNYTHDPLQTQLELDTVRQFEFDISLNDAEDGYDVLHVKGFDAVSTCSTLTTCLNEIDSWHSNRPLHLPIILWIEPKQLDLTETQLDLIDSSVLSVFPRSEIVTPDDIRGSFASVREAVADGSGWPLLSQLSGKVIVVFDKVLPLYVSGAHQNSTDRVAFMAYPFNNRTNANAVFLKLNNPVAEYLDIVTAVNEGYVVRTLADNNFPQTTVTDEEQIAALFLVLDRDPLDQLVSKTELISFLEATDRSIPTFYIDYIYTQCAPGSEVLREDQLECVVSGADQMVTYPTLNETLTRRNMALQSGAHILSTDYPHPFGPNIPDTEYYYLNLTFRCNPVTTLSFSCDSTNWETEPFTEPTQATETQTVTTDGVSTTASATSATATTTSSSPSSTTNTTPDDEDDDDAVSTVHMVVPLWSLIVGAVVAHAV